SHILYDIYLIARPPISTLLPYTTLFRSGLVGRVQAVAVAAVQCLVEGDGDVLRALALQQFQQEAGKAVHRVGRPALRVLELVGRSEEHTSELQSRENIVCRLLLEKKKKI